MKPGSRTRSTAIPDYILEANRPYTALILKQFYAADKYLKRILRIQTSIITFMKIDDKEWKRLLRNKKVLYKSPHSRLKVTNKRLFEVVNFVRTTRRRYDRGNPRDAGEADACRIIACSPKAFADMQRLFLFPLASYHCPK